jgi:hypothetical protein
MPGEYVGAIGAPGACRGEELSMSEERRHESSDLEDYEVLDSSDTLAGSPGDDPLDRGVATPERWSSAMKFGSTAEEQEDGESLDQLLAEEEPEVGTEPDDDRPDQGWDENATAGDITRLASDDGSDRRAGRLVTEDEDTTIDDPDLVAFDSGIDGGGATAEEAAVHVLDEEPDEDDDY